RHPASWGELMARTLQLSLHQRMLSDFERVRRRARVVILCPVLAPGEGSDLASHNVERLVERARQATLHLLRERGRRLFRESGVHYLGLTPAAALVFTTVLTQGPLSRVEIVRRTGLSSGAVTKAVRPLIEAGYLVELSEDRAEVVIGRPASPLRVRAERAFFAGIKVTGDEL